jgi:hypothetical protein
MISSLIEEKSMTSWEELLTGWNSKYGTDFKDQKEMLLSIYVDSINGCKYLEGKIGISSPTIMKKIKELELPVKKRGGINSGHRLVIDAIRKIGLERIKDMTIGQIAKETGFSAPAICRNIRVYRIEFHKLKGGRVKVSKQFTPLYKKILQLDKKEIKTMSAHDIARIVNCSPVYAYNILLKLDIDFNKGKGFYKEKRGERGRALSFTPNRDAVSRPHPACQSG